jgi:hypothetical protein
MDTLITYFDNAKGTEETRPMNANELAELEQTRADFALVKQAEIAEAASLAEIKANAIQKLTALGIDPKALGLQAEHVTPIVTDAD